MRIYFNAYTPYILNSLIINCKHAYKLMLCQIRKVTSQYSTEVKLIKLEVNLKLNEDIMQYLFSCFLT